VILELTHFPVDANRASVVAQEVAAATGTGLLLPTGLTGITCDVNSSADTSVPAETFTEGTFPDYGIEMNEIEEEYPGDDRENPKDDLGADVSVSWATTQSGLLAGPGGWEFEPGGLTIRFNIQDSVSCGGSNPNIQTGQATATITTTRRLFLYLELEGMASRWSSNRHAFKVYLNGRLVMGSTPNADVAIGSELACSMYPTLLYTIIEQPYLLAPGINNTLILSYDDEGTDVFNRNSWRQCTLRFVTTPTGRPA
jgi:hypothetical protein